MTGDNSTVVTLALRLGTGAAGATLTCAQTAGAVTVLPAGAAPSTP